MSLKTVLGVSSWYRLPADNRMSQLQRLKEAGAQKSDSFSDSGTLPPAPDKFDQEKFNRGRKFFQDNIFSCTCAMLLSLICGLSVDRLLKPLVFTQQSNTPKKSFIRYLRTFHHVLLWHLGDVWDPSSTAHESVAKVRGMHSTVQSRMMNNSAEDTGPPDIPVSQYDMSLVQSGFMGAIVMYPDSFGIKCTTSDLSDYCYFWYGIGYLLGIQDENNICKGDIHETVSICREIESDILLPALRDPPCEFHPMAKALTDGMNYVTFFSFLSVEATLAVVYSIMAVSNPALAFVDYLRMLFLKMLFFFVMYIPFCRILLNKLLISGLKDMIRVHLQTSLSDLNGK